MQVTLDSFDKLFTPFKPALNQLTSLFFKIVEFVTSCWGSRQAKPIEVPSKTEIKADKVFKETVLEKKPFSESRFPKTLWDLAAGIKQDDLSFIETVEQSLTDSEKLELRAQIAKKNKDEFVAFLRKLDRFDEDLNHLKDLLTNIRTGKTTRENLKLAVREIRQYFINRSTKTGQDKGGTVEPFVKEFRGPLFGPFLGMGNFYELRDGRIINHHYENRGKTKISGWVAGFTLQEGGHAVAYVYTKEGFVKFDNLSANNRLYSIEEISELLLSVPEDVLTLLKFPLNENTDRLPDARSWMTPTWEQNNCFASASLMFLALCQHYAKDE